MADPVHIQFRSPNIDEFENGPFILLSGLTGIDVGIESRDIGAGASTTVRGG